MSKYKESDWWKGFKEAENLYQNSYIVDDSKSSWNQVYFLGETVGHVGFHGAGEYLTGMIDYIEHRKLNKEIYND